MCDIILLWILGRQLADKAKAKGHAPAPYVIMMVVFWYLFACGGGLMGALAGEAMKPNRLGGRSDFSPLGLLFAIAGMVVAAIVSFAVVGALPDRSRDQLRYNDPGDDFYRRRRDYDERWERDRDRDYPREPDRRASDDPWDKDDRFER